MSLEASTGMTVSVSSSCFMMMMWGRWSWVKGEWVDWVVVERKEERKERKLFL